MSLFSYGILVHMKTPKKRLVLLDAHAIIHRAYHALPGFSSSKGEPTGALYGFISMLISIVHDLKPDAVVACYDLPGKTFRHEAYEEYKAGRQQTKDDLIPQLQRSRDICTAFGIPLYDAVGYEADDMLGTIVHQLKESHDIEIVIASGDMDTLQLVRGDEVTVYTLRKGIKDTVLYNEEKVRERFGFAPVQLTDYKGLRGDPSDNIPGVYGIGEKTAMTLVQKFETIEQLYEKLEKDSDLFKKEGISAGVIKKLEEGKESAFFSKALATIRHDAPIAFVYPEGTSWKQGRMRDPIEKMCLELEFRSLIPRLESEGIMTMSEKNTDHTDIDPRELHALGIGLWLLDSEITHPTLEDIFHVTKTQAWEMAKKKIMSELQAKNLWNVYQEIELPLVPILEKMHTQGIVLDPEYFQTVSKQYHTELEQLEEQIFKLAGTSFNIKSPKQLGEILFDTLGLGEKKIKKTKGGARSTQESELQKMVHKNEIIPLILRYRNIQKILSTYIDNIPKLADGNQVIHTELIQTGTTTGRFSSQNPNLQNIPASDEFRTIVRNGFIARPGYSLLACDYSQIELRVAALLSGEPHFIKIFQDGRDIHTAVASRVFNVDEHAVTKDMRRQAKVINFGIIYGMGVRALQENLGSSREDAQKFYTEYFHQFPGLQDYLENVKRSATVKGYTETLFGRRRYFPGLRSKIPYIQSQAERMAINAPIQGTATADIIKLALVHIAQRFSDEKMETHMYPILQVHDELVFEVEDAYIDQAQALIQDEMEHVLERSFLKYQSPVPLKISIALGKRWGDMKDIPMV